MSVEDSWHPVGLSHSIEAGSSAGTRLFDQELVVWRDNNGVAHVWEDRCPHRGMKLSFGFVRGDHIACLYHGWQYNSGGHCQYIPAHPALDVPKTIKVPVYPVHERGGMVWTTLSENPPLMPEGDEPAVPLRSFYLCCGFEAVVTALNSIQLVPFATDTPADTIVSRVSDTLFAISCAQGPPSGRRSGHLEDAHRASSVDQRAGRALQGAGQNHFNGWAWQWRHAVEQARSVEHTT